MAKKYHAVCVGRKPGLYTEWPGVDGAEAQISGIHDYNFTTGYLSTNNLNDAIAFLKSNLIRKVISNFNNGTSMSFDELVLSCPKLAELLHGAPDKSSEPIRKEKIDHNDPEPPAPQKLNMSRILKTPISQITNDYCNRYGFNHLSEEQRRAVQAVDGKYLLFAVPGSGKTTVMMARAGYMVHAAGIPSDQLMTMTFTRSSAKEMRDRYRRYFPDDDEQSIPDFRTIHSFCMGIVLPKLRRAGFKYPSHVVDEDRHDKKKKKKEYTQRAIMASLLKKHGIPKYSDEAIQDSVQTAFSGIKNREMERSEYSKYTLRIEKKDYPLASLFEDYKQSLHDLDCMDYDDMLIYSLEGLQHFPGVLHALQSEYKYWSIDEAQDNSRVQNELLDLLCGTNGNLFMVGDDDQSIYSFRGAEPNMLLAFGNRPDVHPLVMGVNYRSHSDIVASAKAFVEHNEHRADKQMTAAHREQGVIRIPQSFRNEAEQYAFIDQLAKKSFDQGKHLGVLFQLNASLFPLIVHMHHTGIPFESSKGLSELLTTGNIGKAIRILKFVYRHSDLEAFWLCHKDLNMRWINDDRKKRLEKFHNEFPDVPILQLILERMELEDNRRKQVQKIHQALSQASNLRPAYALQTILTELPGQIDVDSLNDRLYLYGLLSVCDLYDTLHDMLADLDNMKKREKQKCSESNDITPEEETDTAITTHDKPVVSLSTIHSAKGREWEYVVLIDLFEEVFPGEPQCDRIGFDPEEANRVFYVAVTRAIEHLDILTTDSYHGNTEPVSSFISSFAYEADLVTGQSVEASRDSESTQASVLCKLESGKYYSVPIGPKPGVYTNWDEVEAIKKAVGSIPPDLQPKKHDTYEQAWKRVFPDKPLPEQAKSQLACESIKKYMQKSGGTVFNYAIDLPNEVNQGLMNYLRVDSLSGLPPVQLQQLIEQSHFSWSTSQTSYHGKAIGYAVAYMAVNFYKIWLPLWNLLEDNKLPNDPEILEIGPGPGTSTWSIIEFYKRLALENPAKLFTLNYVAIEKEPDFSDLFLSIKACVLSTLPHNLRITMTLKSGVDAFPYMNSLVGNDIDLIIESNVLNSQEDFTGRTVAAFLTGLCNGLSKRGVAILVEPREYQKPTQFARFITYAADEKNLDAHCQAKEAAVNVGGIKLFHDALAANIRHSRSTEHWFSYAILAIKESV